MKLALQEWWFDFLAGLGGEKRVRTSKGWRRLSHMTTSKRVEKIPCGECETTEYREGGEVVRSDVRILVAKGFEIKGGR